LTSPRISTTNGEPGVRSRASSSAIASSSTALGITSTARATVRRCSASLSEQRRRVHRLERGNFRASGTPPYRGAGRFERKPRHAASRPRAIRRCERPACRAPPPSSSEDARCPGRGGEGSGPARKRPGGRAGRSIGRPATESRPGNDRIACVTARPLHVSKNRPGSPRAPHRLVAPRASRCWWPDRPQARWSRGRCAWSDPRTITRHFGDRPGDAPFVRG